MEKIHKTQGTDKKKKILSSFSERWRETHARLHASHRRGHDEWHFFATSHGKSAGDGAGGTLKQLATKASLQHAYKDHILTAHQLYQFAVNSIKAIGGYVTMAYDGESWLGCVVGAHESEHAITVKFLHPCIPAPCFVFPEQEDLLDIDLSDVLTCVNATTATGRTYTLSRKEMQEASVALRARCPNVSTPTPSALTSHVSTTLGQRILHTGPHLYTLKWLSSR
eukprot:Em0176g3a